MPQYVYMQGRAFLRRDFREVRENGIRVAMLPVCFECKTLLPPHPQEPRWVLQRFNLHWLFDDPTAREEWWAVCLSCWSGCIPVKLYQVNGVTIERVFDETVQDCIIGSEA